MRVCMYIPVCVYVCMHACMCNQDNELWTPMIGDIGGLIQHLPGVRFVEMPSKKFLRRYHVLLLRRVGFVQGVDVAQALSHGGCDVEAVDQNGKNAADRSPGSSSQMSRYSLLYANSNSLRLKLAHYRTVFRVM